MEATFEHGEICFVEYVNDSRSTRPTWRRHACSNATTNAGRSVARRSNASGSPAAAPPSARAAAQLVRPDDPALAVLVRSQDATTADRVLRGHGVDIRTTKSATTVSLTVAPAGTHHQTPHPGSGVWPKNWPKPE